MASNGVVARRSTSRLDELARVDAQLYPALFEDMSDLVDTLRENVGAEGLALTDLPRIPMPAGGSTTWEIPDALGGKAKATAELDFLLAYWSAARLWWPVNPDEPNKISGDPPECSSADGQVPLPGGAFAPDGSRAGQNPGGSCVTCPMSKFGSSEKPGSGRGQACSDRRLMFILGEGDILPMLISTPPTSKRALKDFHLGLVRQYPGIHYSAFQIRYALEKVSANGNNYAVVKPTLLGVLDGARPRSQGGPEEGSPAWAAYQYHLQFAKLLDASTLVAAAAAAQQQTPDADTDEMPEGLGGEFADHDAATAP